MKNEHNSYIYTMKASSEELKRASTYQSGVMDKAIIFAFYSSILLGSGTTFGFGAKYQR